MKKVDSNSLLAGGSGIAPVGARLGTGNVRTLSEYGWSGALLRSSTTTYWHESHAGYAPIGLTNLPASVSIKDGAGVEIATTENDYG